MGNIRSGDTAARQGLGTHSSLSFLCWPPVPGNTGSRYPLLSRAFFQVCTVWHSQDGSLAPTLSDLFLPSVLAPWGQQELFLLHSER